LKLGWRDRLRTDRSQLTSTVLVRGTPIIVLEVDYIMHHFGISVAVEEASKCRCPRDAV